MMDSFATDILFKVFLFSCLLPLFNVFLLYRLKLISSIQLEDRDERLLPFVITTLFYAVLAYHFKESLDLPSQVSVNRAVPLLWISIAMGVCIATLITYVYKISMHAVSIGGLLGFLIAFSVYTELSLIYQTSIALVLSGLVLSARLALNAHTMGQIVLGIIVGALPAYFAMHVAFNSI